VFHISVWGDSELFWRRKARQSFRRGGGTAWLFIWFHKIQPNYMLISAKMNTRGQCIAINLTFYVQILSLSGKYELHD